MSPDTTDVYLQILKELAGRADSLHWLPELLKAPVLLTRVPGSDGHQLQFVASAAAAPYLPDHPKLVELFGSHCSLLAVPPAEVPVLQPLLQLVQPPLRSLSASIQSSFTLQDRSTEAQPDEELTLLVQQAVQLAARYLYNKQTRHYLQLLESGQLQGLVEMGAYSAPGLQENLTLTLPDGTVISKQLQAGAAVSEVPAGAGAAGSAEPDVPVTVMLINTANSPGSQHRAVAASLAELLCAGSSSRVSGQLFEPLSQRLKLLLQYVSRGDLSQAEEDLQHSGIGQIPRDKRPWLLPGKAAAATAGPCAQPAGTRTQLWADELVEGDLTDTGSSTAVAAEALSAAQARAQRSAAEHMQGGLAAAAAAGAAAAGAVGTAGPAAGAAAAAGSMMAAGSLMDEKWQQQH